MPDGEESGHNSRARLPAGGGPVPAVGRAAGPPGRCRRLGQRHFPPRAAHVGPAAQLAGLRRADRQGTSLAAGPGPPAPAADPEPLAGASRAAASPALVGLPLDRRPDAEAAKIADECEFAADLPGFLAALYAADPAGGPLPGPHNFFRGGPPAYDDAETRAALTALRGVIDTDLAAEVWEAACRPGGTARRCGSTAMPSLAICSWTRPGRGGD